MICTDHFHATYNHDAAGVAFCPYRICPLGAHSDHQLGKITGMAIDRGIHIAYSPKANGVVELQSVNFPKRAQFHVDSVPVAKQCDWADYLRGATKVLGQRHALRVGLAGVIEGGLPIGGLSSSAAVIIAYLSALCGVNGIRLTEREMIEIAQAAENDYVGVSCGTLDQSCEVLCRKDHLLYLDTKDQRAELIATNPGMKAYKIAIVFSGLERSLVGSQYNMRVDECRAAAYALKAFANVDYGRFNETYLRDVPKEVYEQYKGRLPEPWRRRAEHWFSEFDRVERGVDAWRRGDVGEFGRLVFESGRSSIENYETGAPELKALYEIMLQTDGIYGGRFSGAGFRGCCMALIDPEYEENVIQSITTKYSREFPDLAGKFAVVICANGDGVRLDQEPRMNTN